MLFIALNSGKIHSLDIAKVTRNSVGLWSFNIKQKMSSKVETQTFKPILVSIEGNIGAGKTTLLENLRLRRPDWTFINEPVDSWSKIRNEKDQSILEVFYEDRKRWSYTFQNCALLTRYQEIEAAIAAARANTDSCMGPKVFFTERCLDTDYHVFTKMLKADGSLNSIELQLYERLLKQLKTTATPLSAIVHVNTSPVVCMERVKSRGRAGLKKTNNDFSTCVLLSYSSLFLILGEDAISLGYLKALDYYQSEWIAKSSVPYVATDVSDVNQVENFIQGLLYSSPEASDNVNSVPKNLKEKEEQKISVNATTLYTR